VPLQLLDDQYDSIVATGTDGQVIVDASAPPPPGSTSSGGCVYGASGHGTRRALTWRSRHSRRNHQP